MNFKRKLAIFLLFLGLGGTNHAMQPKTPFGTMPPEVRSMIWNYYLKGGTPQEIATQIKAVFAAYPDIEKSAFSVQSLLAHVIKRFPLTSQEFHQLITALQEYDLFKSLKMKAWVAVEENRLKKSENENNLFHFINAGDTKKAEQLIKLPAALIDINAFDQGHGATPLIRASARGNLTLVKLLLDAGAAINLTSPTTRNSALIAALILGYPEIAQLLIERGADLDTQNNLGWTPLIIASAFNYPEIARLLLRKGARVDLKDKEGKIALEHAQTQEMRDLLSSFK